MTVSSILSEKGRDVVTITSSTTIQEVTKILAAKKIGAAVIVDDGKVSGIASERDLVAELAAHGAAALDNAIETCMTCDVISCREEDTIDTVMAKMTGGRFRHVPVIEDGNLVGIISIGDVVKRKIEQAEHDVEALKHYIAGDGGGLA